MKTIQLDQLISIGDNVQLIKSQNKLTLSMSKSEWIKIGQELNGLRTKYSVTDDKGQTRGNLILSELEAQVLSKQLASGDLMVAKFKLIKE